MFYKHRGKNIYLIRVGKADIAKDGIRIVAAHIDSPRVDLKQVPLYESDGVALAKTHYYGGIRKYQWARFRSPCTARSFVRTEARST